MSSEAVSIKIERLQEVGEDLLSSLDYDLYELWTQGSLKILDLIFGQPSEPYMSFKFPGGGEVSNTREGRVKNTITQKLKVLVLVQEDLSSQELRPKFGWIGSMKEIDRILGELGMS